MGRMKRIALHWQILISLVLAVSVGLIFRKMYESAPEGAQIRYFIKDTVDIGLFLGKLFMSALKMIIVPLIVSSVIAGIASLAGPDRLKQLGAKTLGFYMMSTLVAATVGLLLVNAIKPGIKDGQPNKELQAAFEQAAAEDAESEASKKSRFEEKKLEDAKDWTGIFKKMFPENIIKAATENGQLLGILVFSLMFGIAATTFMPDQVAPVRDFAVSFNNIMIKVTQWIMAVSPIGLFGLMLSTVFTVGAGFIWDMRLYMLTVLLALAVHMFVILPMFLKFFAGVNPWRHFGAMKTALMTAACDGYTGIRGDAECEQSAGLIASAREEYGGSGGSDYRGAIT